MDQDGSSLNNILINILLYRAGFKLPIPIEFKGNMSKKIKVFLAPNGQKYASIDAYYQGQPPIPDVGHNVGSVGETNRVPERTEEPKEEAKVQVKPRKEDFVWDDEQGWIIKKISKDDFVWDDVLGWIRK